MDEQTTALITALEAVAQHVPDVARGLQQATVSTTKQAEFADLLIELGRLLREHADGISVRGAAAAP